MTDRTCSVDDCDTRAFCRGWCQKHYDRWRLTGSPEGRKPDPCVTCDQPVTVPRSGQMPKYCGDDCRPKAQAREWDGVCAVCGIPTDGFAGYRKFCSRKCQVEASVYPDGRPASWPCAVCDAPIDFTRVNPSGRRVRADTRVCPDCRRIDADMLSVQEIAERDGNDCSLCGDPVDMSIKYPDRMAPTRDHIIPYSLGGTHAPENLRLAHLHCNCRKGNRVADAA